MPAWAWVLVGFGVWLSLLIVGARILLIRMALQAQKKAMAEINLGPPRAFGPRVHEPAQDLGRAFGPREHRQKQP